MLAPPNRLITAAGNTKYSGATFTDTTKVTWSYKEHTDFALSASTVSTTANTLSVADATVSKVALVQANGTEAVCKAGDHYTFNNGTLTLKAAMLTNNVGGSLKIDLSTGVTETVTIQ